MPNDGRGFDRQVKRPFRRRKEPPPGGAVPVGGLLSAGKRGPAARGVIVRVLFCVLLYFIVVRGICFTRINTSSMAPALLPGDRFVVMSAWRLGRGDVVSFDAPWGSGEFILKRIVGLPGDVVGIVSGHLFLNGEFILEPYLPAPGAGRGFRPVLVPPGHYFVLGDNRDSSEDSCSWGFLPRERIRGKVGWRYWPPGRAGRLTPLLGRNFLDFPD